MNPRDVLEQKVRGLYEARDPELAADWVDWLYANHVFVVGNNAALLARRYGADEDLAYAAGILHDIADAFMKRSNEAHEQKSLETARNLLTQSGFEENDIKLIVDDAIRYHSCYEGERAVSLEGRAMAAADALAHVKTDFYVHAVWALAEQKELQEIKKWALAKIDRDFKLKLQPFPDLQAETQHDYLLLKELFSR